MFTFKDFFKNAVVFTMLNVSDIRSGFTKNILTLALFSFAFRMRGVVAIVLYGINFTK